MALLNTVTFPEASVRLAGILDALAFTQTLGLENITPEEGQLRQRACFKIKPISQSCDVTAARSIESCRNR